MARSRINSVNGSNEFQENFQKKADQLLRFINEKNFSAAQKLIDEKISSLEDPNRIRSIEAEQLMLMRQEIHSLLEHKYLKRKLTREKKELIGKKTTLIDKIDSLVNQKSNTTKPTPREREENIAPNLTKKREFENLIYAFQSIDSSSKALFKLAENLQKNNSKEAQDLLGKMENQKDRILKKLNGGFNDLSAVSDYFSYLRQIEGQLQALQPDSMESTNSPAKEPNELSPKKAEKNRMIQKKQARELKQNQQYQILNQKKEVPDSEMLENEFNSLGEKETGYLEEYEVETQLKKTPEDIWESQGVEPSGKITLEDFSDEPQKTLKIKGVKNVDQKKAELYQLYDDDTDLKQWKSELFQIAQLGDKKASDLIKTINNKLNSLPLIINSPQELQDQFQRFKAEFLPQIEKTVVDSPIQITAKMPAVTVNTPAPTTIQNQPTVQQNQPAVTQKQNTAPTQVQPGQNNATQAPSENSKPKKKPGINKALFVALNQNNEIRKFIIQMNQKVKTGDLESIQNQKQLKPFLDEIKANKDNENDLKKAIDQYFDEADKIIYKSREVSRSIDKRVTQPFLEGLLENPSLINPKNPTCLAINTLLKKEFQNKADRENLLAALKNPKLMEALPDSDLIDEELKSQNLPTLNQGASVGQLYSLQKKLSFEMETIKAFRESLVGLRTLSKEDRDQRNTYNKRIPVLKAAQNEIQLMIQAKETQKNYHSPSEILGLMVLYKNKNNPKTTSRFLSQECQQLIENEETGIQKRKSKLEKAGQLIGSIGLKNTLKEISKDHRLQNIAEDPKAKLSELGKLFVAADSSKVKEWFESLEGDSQNNLKVVLPTLIAHLNKAILKQKGVQWRSLKNIQQLRRNLLSIRDEKIHLELENEAAQKGWSRLEMKTEYLARINSADRELSDLFKENPWYQPDALTIQSLKQRGKNLALLGGIGATLAFPGFVLGGAAFAAAVKYRKPLGVGAKKVQGGYQKTKEVLAGGFDKTKRFANFVKPAAVVGAKVTAGTAKRAGYLGVWGLKRAFMPWTFITDKKRSLLQSIMGQPTK